MRLRKLFGPSISPRRSRLWVVLGPIWVGAVVILWVYVVVLTGQGQWAGSASVGVGAIIYTGFLYLRWHFITTRR